VSLPASAPVGVADAPPVSDRRNGAAIDRLLVRTVLATGFLLGGISLFVFPLWWRGGETVLAARLMAGWTGQRTVAVPDGPVIVLYKGAVSQMAFLVTNECSVGYLVGALMVLCAPIMMIRRVPRLRVIAALLAAVACLVVTNVTRLAGIGAAVSRWGQTKGLTIGHTYLGSMVTFVGTCMAGAVFAGVLFVGSRHRDRRAPTREFRAGNGE